MSLGDRPLEQLGQPFDATIPDSSKMAIYQGLSELGYPIWIPANIPHFLITGRREVWVKDTATAEKVRAIHSTVVHPPFWALNFLNYSQNLQFSEVAALLGRVMTQDTNTPIPKEQLRPALGVYFLSAFAAFRQQWLAQGLIPFIDRSYLQLAKDLRYQGAETVDLAQPHRLVLPSLELIQRYDPRLAP